MALRNENYLFTRRIADRGSDKIVFDSQDRMIQETDSKDVIWDEIFGKEEHPEEGDGYKFQEADSEAFIRDENYGKDKYLVSCSTLYSSCPCFDCYEDEEVSSEDYWWVTQALNVVVVQEGGTIQEEITVGSLECAKVSTGILNDFVRGEKTEIGLVNDLVLLVANGDAAVKICDHVAKSKPNDVVFPYNCMVVGIVGLFADNCMDVKVTYGCCMRGLSQLAYGGQKEKEVLIIVNMIKGDVPYDPGGCGMNSCYQACGKLEDEFFQRRGE